MKIKVIGIVLMCAMSSDAVFGKWEPFVKKNYSTRVQLNMRNADNSGFVTVLDCREDNTHCKWRMTPDEFRRNFDAMQKREAIDRGNVDK